MPKIIKDVKNNILDAALKQFDLIGYQKVNMRVVAKEAGIAVGTLYNHYPNKNVLFLSALEKSWQTTMISIEDILQTSCEPNEKLTLFITTLYDAIVNRKGLGRELLLEGAKTMSEDDTISTMTTIFGQLETQLVDIIADYKSIQYPHRVANTIVMMTGQLINNYSTQREDNINYLLSLV